MIAGAVLTSRAPGGRTSLALLDAPDLTAPAGADPFTLQAAGDPPFGHRGDGGHTPPSGAQAPPGSATLLP